MKFTELAVFKGPIGTDDVGLEGDPARTKQLRNSESKPMGKNVALQTNDTSFGGRGCLSQLMIAADIACFLRLALVQKSFLPF